MIFLKHNKIYFGKVSVLMPEEIYINNNTDIGLDVGLEFTDYGQTWHAKFFLANEDYDAKSDMDIFYNDAMECQGEEPVKIIKGKLCGFCLKYSQHGKTYMEMAFDAGKAEDSGFAVFHVSVQAQSPEQLQQLLEGGVVGKLLESMDADM